MIPPMIAECPRTPVAEAIPADPDATLTTPELRAAARVLAAAYPGLRMYVNPSDHSGRVIDGGKVYRAEVSFSWRSGPRLLALVLSYPAQRSAAIGTAAQMNGTECRATTELVVARIGADERAVIVSRAALDEEAVAIDVRSLMIHEDRDGVRIQLLYFATYALDAAYGNVGFRSDVILQGSALIGNRLPASYQRTLRGEVDRQEGVIGPEGYGAVSIRLNVARMDSELVVVIEVPFLREGWISGAEMLRRIPARRRGSGRAPPAGAIDPRSLLGTWVVQPGEGSDSTNPIREMDFLNATELDVAMRFGEKWDVRRMHYRVKDTTLLLKPSSASPEEDLRLTFRPHDAIILSNGESRIFLARGKRQSPRDVRPWR